MEVTFWGVRGSLPTPGPKTVRYGGNTTSIEVKLADGNRIVIGAGTGIRELGQSLLPQMPIDMTLMLSHTHWDHINGFPFFAPAFVPGNTIRVRGPVHYDSGETLEKIVAGQMDYSYFPVKLGAMNADLSFEEVKEGSFEVPGAKITAQYLNHPILTLGYRIETEGKVLVTEFDTEPYSDIFSQGEDTVDDGDLFGDIVGPVQETENVDDVVAEMNQRVITFAKNADLLIFDAAYTPEEFPTKVGWGHSTYDDAVRVAHEAGVKRLALFHHEPTRTDDAVDELLELAKGKVADLDGSVEVLAAQEGLTIQL